MQFVRSALQESTCHGPESFINTLFAPGTVTTYDGLDREIKRMKKVAPDYCPAQAVARALKERQTGSPGIVSVATRNPSVVTRAVNQLEVTFPNDAREDGCGWYFLFSINEDGELDYDSKKPFSNAWEDKRVLPTYCFELTKEQFLDQLPRLTAEKLQPVLSSSEDFVFINFSNDFNSDPNAYRAIVYEREPQGSSSALVRAMDLVSRMKKFIPPLMILTLAMVWVLRKKNI